MTWHHKQVLCISKSDAVEVNMMPQNLLFSTNKIGQSKNRNDDLTDQKELEKQESRWDLLWCELPFANLEHLQFGI